MEKFARQAALLHLMEALDRRGNWCGETHLQKSVYFLETGLSVPLEFEFVLYRYGPFSFDLRAELGEMRANYLIDVESHQPYGPSLLASKHGKQLASRFPKTREKLAPQIEFVAKEFAQMGVAELERLGTALYMLRNDPSSSDDKRAERIHELKPHISTELALQSLREVDELLKRTKAVKKDSPRKKQK